MVKWRMGRDAEEKREYFLPPSKIVGIGRNYRAHAKELGNEPPQEPLFFLKPSSSIVLNEDIIVLPQGIDGIDYEGELALVMGQKASKVSVSKAISRVLGYTCANDITARSLKRPGEPWSRSKGFDTFLPIHSMLVDGVDPDDLLLRTRLNGKIVQEARTSEMIFSVAELIAYVSHTMTLLPGDIILTGTPAGVGRLSHGDQVEVEIESVGVLKNKVEQRN